MIWQFPNCEAPGSSPGISMYVLFQAQAHTMEDSSKEKAGVLKHALGFHSHPEKRECSHQRAEVVKGDLALLELTKTCKFTQAGLSCLWALRGQLLLSQDLHDSCLGDPSSHLCLRYFLDTAPGPDGKAWWIEALPSSPSLWQWTFLQRALVPLPTTADLGAMDHLLPGIYNLLP